MNWLYSLLLGVIQGITEFLPVSSFGHLVILQHFLNIGEVPVLFDLLLHAATLAVVILFFRDRIGRMAAGVWRELFVPAKRTASDKKELSVFGVLITGTVITGGIGLVVRNYSESFNPDLVYVLFLVTGIILILSTLIAPKTTRSEPNLRQGIIIGIAQGFGTLPGISRSGITISAALWSGIDRERAGELSFLFSIPAILGAVVLELGSSSSMNGELSFGIIVVGMAAAALAGFLSLRLLIAVIRAKKLHYFSWYLIPLGVLGLIFF